MSKTQKIRTCFIAQDQREHIINGLTVRKALIYASKLKNIGLTVDHELNVNQLMEELDIKDIKNNSLENCSSGQQKRIVMAMELTAEVKPNLICVDEPTSSVDSNSALIVSIFNFVYFIEYHSSNQMIKCFKRLAQKHSLSIITSIHEVNLEVLMIYDLLYVLAKGGVCMFSGRPQQLRQNLTDCRIVCKENQIPIEVLLKIGANGFGDQSVIDLSNKTNQDMSSYEERFRHETNSPIQSTYSATRC